MRNRTALFGYGQSSLAYRPHLSKSGFEEGQNAIQDDAPLTESKVW